VIGSHIQTARKELGWDTYQLAQETALSSLTPRGITRIERGMEPPEPHELQAICRALGLTEAQLRAGHLPARSPPEPTEPTEPTAPIEATEKEVPVSSSEGQQQSNPAAGAEVTERKKPGRKPGQQYPKRTAPVDAGVEDIDARWGTFQTEAMSETDNAIEHRRTYYAGAMDMLTLVFDTVDAAHARTLLAQCQRGILKRA
jgi:transcriptional regulator with XRE-family HTH domain